MASGREQALEILREHLGSTEVGRTFGVDRVRALEDLRVSIPLMDPETHARDVEHLIGFGVLDPRDPKAPDLVGSIRERDAVVGVWEAWMNGRSPRRIAVLRGRSVDPLVDRILLDDLAALGAEVSRLDRANDAIEVMQRLRELDPEVLVVPSASTCAWLERAHRAPLERRLRSLRVLLAEHELSHRIRSRLPLESAGWVHRSGRMGLPTLRSPRAGLVLAVGTQILELLPDGDVEADVRPKSGERTVLPEHAVLGRRYELVITSPLGFLRLRTGEHVRVVGFDAPSEYAPYPRPRVIRLPPAPLDAKLEGCTLAGAWITASVRQAFLPEDPALVAADVLPDPASFTLGDATTTGSMRLPAVFAETELASLARTGSMARSARARALLVRVEVQGHASRELPDRLARRIDDDLRTRSPAYAYLRQRGDLDRPRVEIVSGGVHRVDEDRRISRLLGSVWRPEVRVLP